MRTLLHFVASVRRRSSAVGRRPDARAQSFQGGLRGAVKDAQGVIPASR